MGSGGDTAVGQAMGVQRTPRRGVSVPAPERVYAEASLRLLEGMPVSDQFKGLADEQVGLGHDYELHLTLRKADRADGLIAIEGEVTATLVWTGDAPLHLEDAEFGVGLADLQAGQYQVPFKLCVPLHAPRCVGTLSLRIAGQRQSKTLLRVEVGGDYYAPPQEFVKQMRVSLAAEPNPRVACLNIAANNEVFNVRAHHSVIGNLDTKITQPAFSLAEFRYDDKTSTIYQSVLEYSRSEIRELAAWLKRVTDRAKQQGERLSIVICEHADSRVPWEMLVLEPGGLPLGAMVEITRWTSIIQYANEVTLQPELERRVRGSVVRYIDEERLNASEVEREALQGCAEIPCDSTDALVKQLKTPPNDTALVFLGCHGIVAHNKDHRIELQSAALPGGAVTSLNFEELGVPVNQPVIVVNACHSARLVRNRGSVSGLPAFFLSYFATAFIGTLGAVDDKLAADVGARLLKQARTAKGVRLAEFLLDVRREAVAEYKRGEGATRLVSSFMYVLYGGIGDYLKLEEK